MSHFSWYLPKRNENTVLQKKKKKQQLYNKNIHGNFIPNSPKRETSQVSNHLTNSDTVLWQKKRTEFLINTTSKPYQKYMLYDSINMMF